MPVLCLFYGTAQDVIPVVATIQEKDTAARHAAATFAIENARPTFEPPPSLSYVFDGAAHLTKITVQGNVRDKGKLDKHLLHVAWGDGESGEVPLDPSGSFSASRHFTSEMEVWADELSPVVVSVRDDDGGQAVEAMVVAAVPPIVDMDTYMVQHNLPGTELDEGDEEFPGAYVPLNNDDDDYDPENRADFEQYEPDAVGGWIAGENDLLPIVLHAIQPVNVGGWYRLRIPTNVRVWKNPDRSGEVKTAGANQTLFVATVETTLYVEGIATGSGTISVDWSDNQTMAIQGADKLTIKVFVWHGPLNVPGYSVYRYIAFGGAPGEGESQWLAPQGGTISSTSTTEVDIHWGSGPYVGKAVYQAHPNYVWDLDVNVVKVDVGVSKNEAFAHGEPWQYPGDLSVTSSRSRYAIEASISLDAVQGPVVNGVERGKKFMEIGLSQQGEDVARHADYNDTTPPKRRRCTTEDGQVHWDLDQDGRDKPWISKGNDDVEFLYLSINSDGPVAPADFRTTDKPRLIVTDQSELNGDKVDFFHVLCEFWDYLIVVSKDVRVVDPAPVWTQRARLRWLFDASGPVDQNGVWHRMDSTGVWPDVAFAIVTDGTRLLPAAPNMNQAEVTEQWVEENQ